MQVRRLAYLSSSKIVRRESESFEQSQIEFATKPAGNLAICWFSNVERYCNSPGPVVRIE